MRVSLKAKLTALISLLVLLAVVAVSGFYLRSLVRQALDHAETRGADLAQHVLDQAQAALPANLPPGVDPQDAAKLQSFLESELQNHSALNAAVQLPVADVPSIDYIAITDSQHRSLLHSDPTEVGRLFVPAPRFSDLLSAGFFRQIRIIYGQPQVYEVVLPLQFGRSPLDVRVDVRVGVSTVLLRNSLTPQLW